MTVAKSIMPEPLPERVERFRESLVPYLRAWERHAVRFGALSWLAPPWIGTLYRHCSGNPAEFAHHCLQEYGEVFRSVCLKIDPFAPVPDPWLLRLKEEVPQEFDFTVIVSDETLMYRFPYGHPEREKRGELNDRFLDAGVLEKRMCPVLRGLGPHVGMILLRLAHIYPTEWIRFDVLLDMLSGFLESLPRGFRYAVEIQNPEYILPDYLACLRDHGVAHLLRHETDPEGAGMQPAGILHRPSLLDQVQTPGVLTADFCVLQVCAEQGAAADEVQMGILETVRRCLEERRTLSVYVGDHPGVSAPAFIAGLMAVLNPELARLSPIKRKAA